MTSSEGANVQPATKFAGHAPEGSLRPEVDTYGDAERRLGVATNRRLHDPYWDDSPTAVHFSSAGTFIRIDIENDPLLLTFLQAVSDQAQASATSGEGIALSEQAERVARAVVALTPVIDEDGSFHVRRGLTLGGALCLPVECIDRALALEASLKMSGLADARMLLGVDHYLRGSENHADVVFTATGQKYVAITMGQYAGRVLSMSAYTDIYLPWRKAQGLGARTLHESWGRPYFTAIKGDPS